MTPCRPASVIRSSRSSRVATYQYNEAAPLPSSVASRRTESASRPSPSASPIVAAVIRARLRSGATDNL